jgi:hypothetical protein
MTKNYDCNGDPCGEYGAALLAAQTLRDEVARLRLTDSELEAVGYFGQIEGGQYLDAANRHAAALRGILERRDMNTDNTQDGAEPSPASAGSVSIGEAHNIGYDEWYCQWYLCPKCMKSSINRSFSYCPDCGVQLRWQA